jgi:hypothetical protein
MVSVLQCEFMSMLAVRFKDLSAIGLFVARSGDPKIDPSALAAHPLPGPAGREIGVLGCPFMAAGAVRFDFVQAVMLFLRHCLEVIRTAATTILALMMNVVADRNLTDEQLICEAMHGIAYTFPCNARIPHARASNEDPATVCAKIETGQEVIDGGVCCISLSHISNFDIGLLNTFEKRR